MSSPLTWVFELIDRVSNPAKAMGKALEGIERAAGGAASGVGAAERAIGKSGQTSREAAGHHGSFINKFHDLVEIAYELPKLLGEAAEKVRELFGEVLEEMRFKQGSVIALQAMLGTRDKAIEIFEGVEQFAWQTGQSVKSVMQSTKDMLFSGFDPEAVDSLRLLVSDMAVVDPGKASSIAAIIGEIGRRGELTTRQMRTLSDSGIDATMMWAELARMTGTNADALKKMEGVSFKAGTAITALYNVGVKKFSGGVLGSLSDQMSKTLPALVEKVKHIPQRIIDELAGFTHGAGGGVLEKILGNVADAFDPTSERGHRIIESIRELVNEMGRAFGLVSGPGGLIAELAGPNGPQKVEEIFKGALQWVREGLPAWRSFAGALSDVASALVSIVGLMNGSGGDRLYKWLHPFEGDPRGALQWDVQKYNDPGTDPAARLMLGARINQEAKAAGQVVVHVDNRGNRFTSEHQALLLGQSLGDKILLEMGAAGAR